TVLGSFPSRTCLSFDLHSSLRRGSNRRHSLAAQTFSHRSAHERFRAHDKLLHLSQIFGVASIVLVRLRFRVDAHRRHAPYGLDDIIRSQSSSDNDGNLDSFYDFAIDVPAVGHSEGTYLHITWPMAVQKQQVGYSIVAPCKRDTFVTDDWNAPHQR